MSDDFKIPLRNRNDLVLAKEIIEQALRSNNQRDYWECVDAAKVWLTGAKEF